MPSDIPMPDAPIVAGRAIDGVTPCRDAPRHVRDVMFARMRTTFETSATRDVYRRRHCRLCSRRRPPLPRCCAKTTCRRANITPMPLRFVADDARW